METPGLTWKQQGRIDYVNARKCGPPQVDTTWLCVHLIRSPYTPYSTYLRGTLCGATARSPKPLILFTGLLKILSLEVLRVEVTQTLLCSSFWVVYYNPVPKNHNKPKKELHWRPWVRPWFFIAWGGGPSGLHGGFPKLGVPFWGSIIRTIVFWGLYWVPPI